MSKLKYFLALGVGSLLFFIVGFCASFLSTPKFGNYGLIQASTILLKQGDGLTEVSLVKPANMTSYINTKYKNAKSEKDNQFSVSATVAKGTRDLIRIKSVATTPEKASEANLIIQSDLQTAFRASNQTLIKFIEYQKKSLESEVAELKQEAKRTGSLLSRELIRSKTDLLISIQDPQEFQKNAFKLIYNEPISDFSIYPRRPLFGLIAALLFGLSFILFADLFVQAKEND